MLRLLKEVDAQTAARNHYLGDGGLTRTQQQLAALPESAPAVDRFRLLVYSGFHQLRLGRTASAIASYRRACALLPKVENEIPREFWDEAVLQLAVAYLRYGENANCVRSHTSQSCLLPIRGTGVHREQQGSRNAIQYLRELLQRSPGHAKARWLLNIAFMTVGGYPHEVPEEFLIPPGKFESDEEFPRFANIAPGLGLDTLSLSGGAITDDFNGDGFLDIAVSASS
ncbi:MAG: hypothetical protein GY953_31985, partial [bacterium]|nr:hypothetical protein [bacterium]